MSGVWRFSVYATLVAALAACDAVRFPGDGGPPPKPPEAGGGGDGPPGPPPPTAPVEDPYGLDDAGDRQSDDELRPEPDPEPDPPAEPVSGDEDERSDDAGELETPPEDAAATDSGDDAAASSNLDEGGEGAEGETGTTPPPSETDPAGEPAGGEGEPVDEPGDTVEQDAVSEPGDTPPGLSPPLEPEPAFSYYTPGALLPGSGQGAPDATVYSPDMVFPILGAPAFPQSMVWRFGGGIGGGDECDPRNYQYPWQDNFCETRSSNRGSPYCPVNRIHQGQDIRVGDAAGCNQMRRTPAAERTLYKVVAVEDGVISNIGSYTVNLRAGGRIYRYMHMNMRALQVSLDQEVKAGDVLGYVSKDFGGSPTTFHLHFEIIQNTAEHGWVHAPPYTSLVAAYERREGGPGEQRQPNVAVASAIPEIPDGFEITE